MFVLTRLFSKSIWGIFILLNVSTACYAVDYTYDELHRLVKAQYESGQTIHYEYDAGGNLLSASETQEEPKKHEDWQRVMNWAESTYTDVLPINGKEFMESPLFMIRYYPSNDTYLGYNLEDDSFYGYNLDLWGEEIVHFGHFGIYLPLATQTGF